MTKKKGAGTESLVVTCCGSSTRNDGKALQNGQWETVYTSSAVTPKKIEENGDLTTRKMVINNGGLMVI